MLMTLINIGWGESLVIRWQPNDQRREYRAKIKLAKHCVIVNMATITCLKITRLKIVSNFNPCAKFEHLHQCRKIENHLLDPNQIMPRKILRTHFLADPNERGNREKQMRSTK
jgi:hypothetical protein